MTSSSPTGKATAASDKASRRRRKRRRKASGSDPASEDRGDQGAEPAGQEATGSAESTESAESAEGSAGPPEPPPEAARGEGGEEAIRGEAAGDDPMAGADPPSDAAAATEDPPTAEPSEPAEPSAPPEAARPSDAAPRDESSMTDSRAKKNSFPWGDDAPEAGSFGTWLRQQREVREITLREISETSKISLRYLEAFEDDRFDLLPAPVFSKGFLRQYARYVGLDPDEVVNRFLVANQVDQDDEPNGPGAADRTTRERSGHRSPRRGASTAASGSRWWIAAVVVVLLLAGLFFLTRWLENRNAGSEPAEAAPMARPAEEGEAGPEGSEGAPGPSRAVDPNLDRVSTAALVVTLDFRADSWVEASVDGRPEVSEMRVQGESLLLEAEETVGLRLGNAGGVSIEVNGRPYPLDASSGEVLSLEIDRQDLPEAERASAAAEDPTGATPSP